MYSLLFLDSGWAVAPCSPDLQWFKSEDIFRQPVA